MATSFFSMAGLIRTGVALGLFAGGQAGGAVAEKTYEKALQSDTLGPFLNIFEGTPIGNFFKHNWTEVAGLLGGVIAAPGKWPKILVLIGGLYTMYSDNLPKIFSGASNPEISDMTAEQKLRMAERLAQKLNVSLVTAPDSDIAATGGKYGIFEIPDSEFDPDTAPELDA